MAKTASVKFLALVFLKQLATLSISFSRPAPFWRELVGSPKPWVLALTHCSPSLSSVDDGEPRACGSHLSSNSEDPTPPFSPTLTNALRFEFGRTSSAARPLSQNQTFDFLPRSRPTNSYSHSGLNRISTLRPKKATTVVVVKSASAHSFKCLQRQSSSLEEELEDDFEELPHISHGIRHLSAQAMAIVGISPNGDTWTPQMLLRAPNPYSGRTVYAGSLALMPLSRSHPEKFASYFSSSGAPSLVPYPG